MLDRTHCEFRGRSMLIRPWQRNDVDSLYDAARESLGTVGRWLPWCHENYARTDSEAWLERCPAMWKAEEEFPFAILADDGLQVLGGVGLNKFDHTRRTANLGYWVRSGAQSRGVATQAVRLISAFGFEYGFAQLEIVAAVDNVASRRVAEKSGARYQGIEHGRIHFREQRLDAAIYLLTPAQNAA